MNKIDEIMALHDEAAEARHVNGSPLYNAVADQKRQALRAAIEKALSAPVPEPLKPSYYVIRHNDDGEFGQKTGWLWRDGGHPCVVTGKPVYVWRPLSELLAAAPQQQPKQEPVAWSVLDKRTGKHWYTNESKYTAQHYANEYSHREPDGSPSMVVTPLYTAPPPQREWVGLSKEDMPGDDNPMYDHEYFIKGMVWADAKLREKNGGGV